MFFFFFFIFYIIVLLFIKGFVKDYLSKMLVLFFASFWFISLMISSTNPLGLFEVTDRTYFILLCNVLSFVVGFSIVRNTYPLYSRETYAALFSFSLDRFIKNKVILILGILATLFLFTTAQTQMAILAVDANEMSSFSTGENDVLFANPLLSIVYNVFIPVIFQIVLFLFPYFLLYKKNILYSTLLGIFIVSRALIGGSRGSIFVIVIYFICVYFLRELLTGQSIRKKKRKNKIYQTVVLSVLGIAVYIIMVFLTSLRHGNADLNLQTFKEYSGGLQRTFVNYSCGPFRGMDYGLEHHFDDYAGGMLMGRSTISGFEDLLNLFTKRVGIDIEPVSRLTVQHQQDVRISVSDSFQDFNYAYTNAMIFYYDGKIVGVIVLSFLFGLFARLAIRQMYREMTLPAVLLVAYIFYGIYHSPFTWFLVKHYAWLYIILLMIWHYFEKRKCSNFRKLYLA